MLVPVFPFLQQSPRAFQLTYHYAAQAEVIGKLLFDNEGVEIVIGDPVFS
jgi:hypothetical protein